VEELEQRLGLSRQLELTEQAAALGEARRRAFNVSPTQASRDFGERVKSLAGKHNVLVEWTLRDVSSKVEDTAVCRCTCYA
jgi:hypothetical protein